MTRPTRCALRWARLGLIAYYQNRSPLFWAVMVYLGGSYLAWLVWPSYRPDFGPLPVPGPTLGVEGYR